MGMLWTRLRGLRRGLFGLPIPTLASRQAYALWSAAYPPYAHNRLMEIEQEAMLRRMPALTGRVVLDMACGTGRYGLLAQQAGARLVVGADNSFHMLKAGKLPSTAEATMIALPFAAGSFGVVICALATGHLPPDAMRRAAADMGRVLQPGGEALISDFHPFLYLHGGRRTFKAADGTEYAVEHYPHLVSDYFEALTAAGLVITALDEPTAEVNGSGSGGDIKGSVPAVLIIRCKRPVLALG